MSAWQVERNRNPMSFAVHYVVVRRSPKTTEYMLNERGRIKRFRSEESARIAAAAKPSGGVES